MKKSNKLIAILMSRHDQALSSARAAVDGLSERQYDNFIAAIGLGMQDDPDQIASRIAAASDVSQFIIRELAVVGYGAIVLAELEGVDDANT